MAMVGDLLGEVGPTRKRRLRYALLAVTGLLCIAVAVQWWPGRQAAETMVEGTGVSRVHIEGFRSAQFGMNESAVRAAIATDFGAKLGTVADAIKVADNKVERTRILVVRVPDLFDNAGSTEIGYVLGYKSKALMQVNLLWGTPLDPKVTQEELSIVTASLMRYFVSEGFAAKDVKSNVKLGKGAVLVFQGSDASGHMVQLVRRTEQAGSDPAQKRLTLRLAYIADPKAPDTFQIGKGAF